MSSGNRKDKFSLIEQYDLENFPGPSSHSSGPHKAANTKAIRRVSPLGLRVLVRILGDTNVSDGGLYLPEGAKQAMSESLLAEVLEVASAVDHHTDEETNVSGVPLGAKVLIKKNSGVKVPWDEALRIVETVDVLAIVNEIEIT